MRVFDLVGKHLSLDLVIARVNCPVDLFMLFSRAALTR